MRKILIAAALASVAVATSATAQINWGLLQPQPNYAGNAMNAYAAGQRAAAERDAAMRAQMAFQSEQRERAAAEARFDEDRRARGEALQFAVKGQCEDAARVASATGDAAFVASALDVCQRAPKAP